MGDGKIWGRDKNGITRRNVPTDEEREAVIEYWQTHTENTDKAVAAALNMPQACVGGIIKTHLDKKQPK